MSARIYNNKGFTLVEVLASLALLSIVAALSVSLIITIHNNKDAISDNATLQQKTNLLIKNIEQSYYNTKGQGEIPLHIDSSKIKIKQLVVNGIEKNVTSPIQGIDFDKTLRLDLIIQSAHNPKKEIEIRTAFKPNQDETLTIKNP